MLKIMKVNIEIRTTIHLILLDLSMSENKNVITPQPGHYILELIVKARLFHYKIKFVFILRCRQTQKSRSSALFVHFLETIQDCLSIFVTKYVCLRQTHFLTIIFHQFKTNIQAITFGNLHFFDYSEIHFWIWSCELIGLQKREKDIFHSWLGKKTRKLHRLRNTGKLTFQLTPH